MKATRFSDVNMAGTKFDNVAFGLQAGFHHINLSRATFEDGALAGAVFNANAKAGRRETRGRAQPGAVIETPISELSISNCGPV